MSGKELFDAVSEMTNEIAGILEGRLWGAWLCGSAVLDDFRMGWSDIDLIVLTDGKMSACQAEKLLTLRQDMLKKEPDDPYARSFEGVIADLDEYRGRSFSTLVYWGTSGQRLTGSYTPDVFSEFVLARHGKTVYGGKEWILPEPGRKEMIGAVRAHLDAVRRHAARTNGSLYSCGWLLDVARCVYTLRHNDVIAKTQAGVWALENHVFPDEAPLRRAVEIRRAPLAYKDDGETKRWLEGLGPAVQRCADVLEKELACAR